MRRARLVVLALFFVVAGCATALPADARRIFNARPLIHEAWYERLYREVQECLGKQGPPFSRIEWYVVPRGSMGTNAGLWSFPNRLYVDERYVLHSAVLKHELVHYVDQGKSGRRHGDREYDEMFRRCSGLAS